MRPRPRPASKDPCRWETWWEHEKERFLVRRQVEVASGTPTPATDAPHIEEIRAEKLLPMVRALVRHEHCGRRAAAVNALSRLGDRFDVPLLAGRLADPCPEVRAAACLALASVADSEDVSRTLRARLAEVDEPPLVRCAAAVALGLVHDRTAVPALARLLSDPRCGLDLRAACATALGLNDDTAGTAVLVSRAGDEREDPVLRAVCVSALGRQTLLENALLIARWLGDDRVEVRRAAARALGRIGYRSAAFARLEAARDRLVAWLRDGSLSPVARRELEEMIGGLESRAGAEASRVETIRRGAVRALRRTVDKDSDLQARAFALLGLGEMGGAEAALVIRPILDRKTHSLKAWACLAGGLLGDRSLVPAIRGALGRERDGPSQRGAAAIALGLLADPGADPLLAAIANDRSEDPDLRGHALLALAMAGGRNAPRRLRELVTREEPTSFLRSGMIALGIAGRRDSVTLLLGCLRGQVDPTVRSAAAIGLRYLKSPDAAQAVSALMRSRSEAFSTQILATVASGHAAGRREASELPARLAWGHPYRLELPVLTRIVAWL